MTTDPRRPRRNRGPGLFVTGTDTGVGKTWVTAAIARLLRQQGRSLRVCKPVATGADWVEGRWLSKDTLRLAEAVGVREGFERITPFAFPDPVAPPVAARRQGKKLTLEALIQAVDNCRHAGEALLVEGVGGLLCPLTERETVADLAAALALPLVVVSRRSLGTLNHTLLTLEVAHGRGLPVAGIVINETERAGGLADETNAEQLRHRIAVPLLAVVPYQAEASVTELSCLASVDWWRLCHELVSGE